MSYFYAEKYLHRRHFTTQTGFLILLCLPVIYQQTLVEYYGQITDAFELHLSQ